MKTRAFHRRVIAVYLVTCLFVLLTVAVPVRAAEADGAATMTLQQTVKDIQIKAEPEQNSDTLAKLQKGTAVIVYGEPQNSWSHIDYDGINGYIESSALEAYSEGESMEGLDEEFDTVENETERTVDEHELRQKSKRTSLIWGTVIVSLVIAIFVVGVVSVLKKDKTGES